MYTRRLLPLVFPALLLAAPAAAQHEHMHPAPADTMRRDTASAPKGGMEGMAGMEGMNGGETMPGMKMDSSASPLGIPMSRMGSGTSWMPDASPMHAKHYDVGGWDGMLHGVLYGYYDKQNGPRGTDQWGSVNWAMLMAAHPLSGGRLQLRGMVSAEPWTVHDGGYPLLLQTGESHDGQPLHDRQHPHDLFMELAALYERPISRNLGFELYGGPVGEPALGPVAYPHRPSAGADPMAPIGHHWEDATHISFGVVTAGLFSRRWKVEGSVFNGREPDDVRTNFDMGPLDSYSGRVVFNPNERWSLSASAGYLKDAEQSEKHASLRRYNVSAMHGRTLGVHRQWSSTVMWSANQHVGESTLQSAWLAETTLDLDERSSLFARAELVRKSADDLVLGTAPPVHDTNVGSLAAGYVRDLLTVGGFGAGLGLRGALNFVPAALEPYYGSRTPTGWSVYVRLRPRAVHMHDGGKAMHHGSM